MINTINKLDDITISLQEFEKRIQESYIVEYTSHHQDHCSNLEITIFPVATSTLKFIKKFLIETVPALKNIIIKAKHDPSTYSIDAVLIIDEKYFVDMMTPISNISISTEIALKNNNLLPQEYDFTISLIPNRNSLDIDSLCKTYSSEI